MDKSEMENLLKAWDLEELNDLCNEQHIDMKSLHHMTFESLNIIPQIGLRLRFWEKIQAFTKPVVFEKLPELQSPIESDAHSSSTSCSAISAVTETEPEEGSVALNYDVDSFVGEPGPPTKKPKIVNESCKYLERLLKSSNKGKYVLAFHEKHGVFNKEARQKLVEVLVDDLLSKDVARRVPSAELNGLAVNIHQMFPSENKETYFCTVTHNGKTTGKGKLCQRYYNLRRRFLDVGLIHKNEKQDILNGNECSHNDKEEYLKWLENSINPWTTVLKYWDETYDCRKQLLTKNCEIYSYFKRFPALTSANGFELLEQDFLKLHPDKELALFANFDKTVEAFAVFLKDKQEKNLKEKVDDYFSEESFEPKKLKFLLLLPYLIQPVTVKKNKEGQWRPSRLEVEEAFILHVTDIGKIEEHIENRRAKLLKWKLNLQPFIIVVGPTLCEIKDIYVQIDQWSFRIPGILKAVDVTFKTFFVLNAQYPPEAEQVWILIEKLFYDIQESPNKYTSLTAFISDIKNLIK